jgi:tetratricopeptide (TPR) repeat protein
MVMIFFAGVAGVDAGDEQTPLQKKYWGWTQKVFVEAQAKYRADSNNVAVIQTFASACFDSADNVADDGQREGFARLGVALANQLIARDVKSGPGHYYLAMNSGQLAKAEAPSLAAYHLVKVMEKEFKLAVELDEKFDFGGPARNFGLLYRDAPGWPLSIGSKHKAKEFLERAVSLAPDYPENRLNLAESYVHWKEPELARRELNALDEIWSKAMTQLTGPEWGQSWEEWTGRREILHKKLDETAAAGRPGH